MGYALESGGFIGLLEEDTRISSSDSSVEDDPTVYHGVFGWKEMRIALKIWNAL